MSCPTDQLELFHDGELAPAERDAVRTHLADCAACRAEVEQIGKLDGVLKVPVGAQPKWDRFVAGIRVRTTPSWGRRIAAIAAALLLGVTIWNVVQFSKPTRTERPVALRDPVGAYLAARTDADRARVLATIRDEQLPEIVAALDHPDVKRQIAAAQMLGSIRNQKVEKLLEAYKDKQKPLTEASGDLELSPERVVSAMREAEKIGEKGPLLNVVGPGALDVEIREAVSKWSGSLLASSSPRLRRLGLEIVKEVDVDFPWAQVVDLVDAPEVGGLAVEVLREKSGQDFGTDKQAWKRHFEN